MAKSAQDVIKQGDRLFQEKAPLLTLWQEIAENFCPFRAEFTTTRDLGENPVRAAMTGVPFLAHRDLSNSLSAMLRPTSKPWFHCRTTNEDINASATARKWLDKAAATQRRLMYDPRARFVRATKEGDSDFAAFGQCVISVDENQSMDGFLYRSWHLKDVVWTENEELSIDSVHRKWKITAEQLVRLFPDKAHADTKKLAKSEPLTLVKCRHVMMPYASYDASVKQAVLDKTPFVSLYIDEDNNTLLEMTPRRLMTYVIPRWARIPGSQYAFSHATAIALPDAKMLQQISLTLLEAGQKAVDPPLKAVYEAIQGGANMFAGGITWVDAEYDERTGAALEPILGASPQLNWGERREDKVEMLIKRAFYLDQLTLPPVSPTEMTLGEINQRVEEYTRQILPLFEPMETEYNGGLCDVTFSMALSMGAFGAIDTIPQELRGQEIKFLFESPLLAANERAKAQSFQESASIIKIAAQMDPGVVHDFDVSKATRDAIIASGAPAEWVIDEKIAAQSKQQAAQQAQATQQAAMIQQGAQVANDVGAAAQSLQAGGVM